METVVNRLYEAMFLIDSALAASDWDGVNKAVKTILEKVKAEVVSLRKWDERTLAYPVNKKVRGTFLLCYFRSDSDKIQTIEREVQLSDNIMRVLILKADHMTQEDLDKETPTDRLERLKQEALESAAKAQAEKDAKAEAEAKAEPAAEPEQAEEAEQTAEPEQTAKAEEDVVGDAVEGEVVEQDQAEDSDANADDDQEPQADQVETTDEDTKE